jgi:hypothetical protein
MITDSLKKYVRHVMACLKRIIILQLAEALINTDLIQVYALTADKEDISDAAQLRDAVRTTKKNEINIFLGDFNAKIGRGAAEGVIAKYSLEDRNVRGHMLVQFCLEKEYEKHIL